MTGLYVVTVNAVPAVDSGPLADFGGACINVYIQVPSASDALAAARREVAKAGWRITDVDGVTWVTREHYADDAAGLEYFEQALIDSVVLVAHTYPVASDDGTLQ